MITQAQVTDLFEYRDGALYWKVKRGGLARAGERAGCLNADGYRQVKIDGKACLEHRIIYLLCHGYLPEFLDHIDGDAVNNRVENLRPCTVSQNNCNAKIRHDNTSGVKGVCWHKQTNRWQALLRIASKRCHLGYFDTIAEAKAVLDIARATHHGNFARF